MGTGILQIDLLGDGDLTDIPGNADLVAADTDWLFFDSDIDPLTESTHKGRTIVNNKVNDDIVTVIIDTANTPDTFICYYQQFGKTPRTQVTVKLGQFINGEEDGTFELTGSFNNRIVIQVSPSDGAIITGNISKV